jgi:hypothetical protein
MDYWAKFGYSISNKMNISVNPGLIYTTSSFTSESSNYDQSFTLYGINASIQYLFD